MKYYLFQQGVDQCEGCRHTLVNCWFHNNYAIIGLYPFILACELVVNVETLVPRFLSHSRYQLVEQAAQIGACI